MHYENKQLQQSSFNRTIVELKLHLAFINPIRYLLLIVP